MDRRTAWEESTEDSDSYWTLGQLCDQYQKAVHLSGLAENGAQTREDDNASPDHDASNNSHNMDHNVETNEDSDDVPQKRSEPYKNKYMARILLVEMKAALSKQFDRLSPEEQDQSVGNRIQERLLAVSLQLGLIAIGVQERSTGEEHFTHIAQALTDRALHPRCINLLIAAQNQLGLLWAERLEYSKGKEELLRASQFYKDYKELNPCTPPVPIKDLFLKCEKDDGRTGEGSSRSDAVDGIVTVAEEVEEAQQKDTDSHGQWSDLEQLHTYTFYYLAQICGHLGEGADAACFCHATLHRQLADTVLFEPLDWSKNAANLASYYFGKKNYRMARYLLASAFTMLQNNAPTMGTSNDMINRYRAAKAEVDLFIGNYCIRILQDSEAALEDNFDSPPSTDTAEPSDIAVAQWEQNKFVGLNPETVEEFEKKMPGELVRDYEGARQAFLVGLVHLEAVTNFYTLDDHASQHAEAIQRVSRLYQGLAAFEPKPDRRSKMHKRRVDMLTHLLQELNQQFYLQVCRQLRYELAETYSKMAACKEEPSEPGVVVTPQQLSKSTSLALLSIEHYKLFLENFRTPEGTMPSRYPEETERAALVAMFHMGRLWNRMTAASRSQGVVNITNAINCFKQMTDYVRGAPESEEKVKEELELARELVELLPLKLAQLQQ